MADKDPNRVVELVKALWENIPRILQIAQTTNTTTKLKKLNKKEEAAMNINLGGRVEVLHRYERLSVQRRRTTGWPLKLPMFIISIGGPLGLGIAGLCTAVWMGHSLYGFLSNRRKPAKVTGVPIAEERIPPENPLEKDGNLVSEIGSAALFLLLVYFFAAVGADHGYSSAYSSHEHSSADASSPAADSSATVTVAAASPATSSTAAAASPAADSSADASSPAASPLDD